MVHANAMVVAWQTDFMYIEYRQLFLLNCSDRVQCSSFHIGYAASLPVGVVDLPMNTIDGGVEGMHKDWIHYVVPHAFQGVHRTEMGTQSF